MKVSRETKVATTLLAKAFIAARTGDEKQAGSYMLAACRTDALDPVMHGIAASMGMEEDSDFDDMEAADCCQGDDCFDDMEASDEDGYDDMEASDDDDDEADEVEFDEVEFDEDGDGAEEETEVDITASADDAPAKVAIPASCYRLARARY